MLTHAAENRFAYVGRENTRLPVTEDKNGHVWSPAPPGTATGLSCEKCGLRHAHPKAQVTRCTRTFSRPSVKPALWDFDPYQ